MHKSRGRKRETGKGRPAAVVLLVALGLTLAVLGCSSDDSNLVGASLVDTTIDTTLETVLVTEVTQYTGKTISEPDLPVPSQEMLYLGSQGGTSSSILVNYDLSEVYTDSFPAEAFTLENIQSVKLQMIMADYYINLTPRDQAGLGDKVLSKYYEVFQLEAPFDTTAYPGPIPAYDPTDLNIDPVLDEAGEVQVDISAPFFLNWVQAGESQGLLVQEGPGSVEGLTGFAARDNRHMGSQFPTLGAGTTQGPALVIKFVQPDSTLSIKPVADTSTFHQIAEAPLATDDGFFMRTCLRSYPVFRFDLSVLPEDVYINRAVLYVANDTISSFGNLESIVISEFDMDRFGVPGDSLPLDDLNDATYQISGMTSLDPTFHAVMQFNVTQAVQRLINNVYDNERGLIMTAGEDFFPNYDLSTVDPDFYFTQFNFFGTSAPDSLRPQLRITYSGVDELTGGGE